LPLDRYIGMTRIQNIRTMKIKLLGATLSLLLLNGCATYYEQASQTSCLTTHWFEEGFDTAKHGVTKAKGWFDLNNGCEEYNIWSDRDSFDSGYELGLTEFCTQSNGFEFGQRNRAYAPICHGDLQVAFDESYDDGVSLYHAAYNLDQATENLAIAQSEVSEGQARRRYLKKQIKSGSLDKETEKKYVKERYRLKHQISSARSSISSYKSDVAEFSREQSVLEYKLFSKYYDGDGAEEDGYSAVKSVYAESIELNEPAILLYKPENMERSARAHYKKLAKKINKYISTTVDRSFRYQVVRDTELVFNPGSVNESITSPASSFRHPALLFWDGESELNSIELSPNITEPPLAELARFVQLIAEDNMLLLSDTQSQ